MDKGGYGLARGRVPELGGLVFARRQDPTPAKLRSGDYQICLGQSLDQFIVERPAKQPKSFFARTSNYDMGNAVFFGERN